MLSLFDAQWRTGMLPHIAFNRDVPAGAYFPGPDFWRSTEFPDAPPGRATSGITQPPVHGFASLEMHRRARNPEQSVGFLRRLYPGLLALHRYLRDRRAGPEGPRGDRAPVGVGPGQLPGLRPSHRTARGLARDASPVPAERPGERRPARPPERRGLRALRLPGHAVPRRRLRRRADPRPHAVPGRGPHVQRHLGVVGGGPVGDRRGRRRGRP